MEKICSIDGCNDTSRTRGLCVKHYKKWLVDTQPTCSVDGCNSVVLAQGWCSKHYARWRTHGDPLFVLKEYAERGAPQEFVEMALNHQDKEECLFWPYGRTKGYAIYNGKKYVSRFICEKVHGPPPTTEHQASHNCGKGNLGCINPHHLEWKTPKGNNADKIIHRTDNSGERSGSAILTWEKVREIRTMQGKLSSYKVAAIFGVSNTAIHNIWYNKTWKE